MKIKNVILIAAAVMMSAFLTGCDDADDLKITSFELVSVTPRGMNGLEALVNVGVHNPNVAFELSDMVGTLKLEDDPCLSLSADQLIVDGKSDKIYSIPVHGKLAEGFNPFQLLRIINGYSLDFDELTVDISGKVAMRGGIGKKVEINDIKVGDYLRKKDETQNDE